MPEKLDRCVKKLKEQGYDEDSAWAICTDAVMNDKEVEQAEADWKAENQMSRRKEII